MKFLIDEDISPSVARYLCEQLLIDAVAVRDRGLLGVCLATGKFWSNREISSAESLMYKRF